MAGNNQIALAIQPVEQPDLLGEYAKAARVQNMIALSRQRQQNEQLNAERLRAEQLKNQETQRAIGGRSKLSDLLSQHATPGPDGSMSVDHYAVMRGLSDAGYPDLSKQWDAQRRLDLKSETDQASAHLKNIKEKLGIASSLVGSVRNAPADADKQSLWTGALQKGLELGVIDKNYAEQHAAYDPAFVEQEFQSGVEGNQQVSAAERAMNFRQKVITEAPDTAKKWNEVAFNQASGAQSQAELDSIRDSLKNAGAPPEVLRQIPDMWSQTAVDAMAKRALTADQRAVEADKEATRKQGLLTPAYKNFLQSQKEGFTGTFDQWREREAKMKKQPVSNAGTWQIQEGPDGKPVLFNSKTGQTETPPNGLQRSGTAAKEAAAKEKEEGPARTAIEFADNYLKNGVFTGSGDEALQEKFFELAKPSVGFRMTQPQMNMLQNSRSWMEGVAAHFRHATKGTWFDNDQRQQIVNTMKELAAAKLKTKAAPAEAAPAGAPKTAEEYLKSIGR